jgi:hypothetical protein
MENNAVKKQNLRNFANRQGCATGKGMPQRDWVEVRIARNCFR